MRVSNTGLNIPDYPQRVVLELTPKCNLSCSMCPRNYIKENEGFMTKGLWKRLIDEIAEQSPDSIILPFWRGESLLHPEFAEFIEYALSKSLRIHVSTNGHLITGESAALLAKCELVTFSVHAPLGYGKAKEFLKTKQENKPIVQVSFVAGETTEAILKKLIDTPDLEGFDNIRLYEEHSKDGVFGKSSCSIDVPRGFCRKLLDTVVIDFSGKVSRCNHIWETEEGIDVNQKSIKEVWVADRFQKIRDEYPDARCSPCDQWTGHTCGASWRISAGKIEHRVIGQCVV